VTDGYLFKDFSALSLCPFVPYYPTCFLTAVCLNGKRLFLFFSQGESLMASNTQKRKKIMKNKAKPNKANRRADAKRTQKNREILKQLAGK
jgi:hypothetical protein